jgi:hypothetical protein
MSEPLATAAAAKLEDLMRDDADEYTRQITLEVIRTLLQKISEAERPQNVVKMHEKLQEKVWGQTPMRMRSVS